MRKFISQLQSIGVKQEYGFAEKLRIELCNLFVAISFVPCILHLTYNLFTDNILNEYFIIGIWMAITAVTIYLNHKHKHFSAKVIVITCPIILITSLRILYGVDIRIEPMFVLLILISSYFFKLRIAIFYYIFIIVCYLITEILLAKITPPFQDQIVASGSYAYLIFSILVVIILTSRVLWENRKFNEILSVKNKQLEIKNEELQRFTYIAAHDLKTPLRNIKNYAGLIKKNIDQGRSQDINAHLGVIDEGIAQMYFLVDDISQFNTIENQLNENKAEVDLNKVVSKSKMALNIDQQGISIQIEKPLSHLFINFSIIQIVFQNIIENALKYNQSKNPTLKIYESSTEKDYIINFEDNGIGIDPNYQTQIFEYFKRLHTKDLYSGTGLGLGICKKIIESLEGEISVQSEINAGSIFTIKLPISMRV